MRSASEHLRADFHCPHCDAGYRMVRIKNESDATYPSVRCCVCGGPLPATEGGEILKYLLAIHPRNWRRAKPSDSV
jgi:hypothetical protein